MANFRVTRQEEVLKIIEIFQNSHLNTTKHLNFLAFSQAFYLYIEKHNKTIELKSKIDDILIILTRKDWILICQKIIFEFLVIDY